MRPGTITDATEMSDIPISVDYENPLHSGSEGERRRVGPSGGWEFRTVTPDRSGTPMYTTFQLTTNQLSIHPTPERTANGRLVGAIVTENHP